MIILELPSYTYAVKAEKILRSRGMRCELKRRDEGCGYDICIYSKTAAELLRKQKIPFNLKEEYP